MLISIAAALLIPLSLLWILFRFYVRLAIKVNLIKGIVANYVSSFPMMRDCLAKFKPRDEALYRQVVSMALYNNNFLEDCQLDSKIQFHSERLKSRIKDSDKLIQAAHICALCRIAAEREEVLCGSRQDVILIALMEKMIVKNIHVLK
jgi:hypothetical protein